MAAVDVCFGRMCLHGCCGLSVVEATPGDVARNVALPSGSFVFSLECGIPGPELIRDFRKSLAGLEAARGPPRGRVEEGPIQPGGASLRASRRQTGNGGAEPLWTPGSASAEGTVVPGQELLAGVGSAPATLRLVFAREIQGSGAASPHLLVVPALAGAIRRTKT